MKLLGLRQLGSKQKQNFGGNTERCRSTTNKSNTICRWICLPCPKGGASYRWRSTSKNIHICGCQEYKVLRVYASHYSMYTACSTSLTKEWCKGFVHIHNYNGIVMPCTNIPQVFKSHGYHPQSNKGHPNNCETLSRQAQVPAHNR